MKIEGRGNDADKGKEKENEEGLEKRERVQDGTEEMRKGKGSKVDMIQAESRHDSLIQIWYNEFLLFFPLLEGYAAELNKLGDVRQIMLYDQPQAKP